MPPSSLSLRVLPSTVSVFKDTGVAGTSPLLFYIDGFTVTPNGGDITVQWANALPFIAKL